MVFSIFLFHGYQSYATNNTPFISFFSTSSNLTTSIVHFVASSKKCSLESTMVAFAGRSTLLASRKLWNQQGRSVLATFGANGAISYVQTFHSFASSWKFDVAPGSRMTQTRCFSSGKRDFYKVLGVPKGSDKSTIKKAYFKLAKEHHPDTNKVNCNCWNVVLILKINF